ncbi:MAG: acyltransferase [Chloroflexi bacterium]|nr:MAG: acyltransferase [Chloroflexota bacterium]
MPNRVLRLLLHLATWPLIGAPCLKLACRLVGPYKARRRLVLISGRTFVSPYADVLCPQLHLGERVFIDDAVTIYAHRDGGEVRIGDDSTIQRHTILELIRGGNITIGRDTHIQSGCHLTAALANIVIGDHVQLAPRCALYPYQHGYANLSMPMARQPITSKGDIVIEDDVWLGVGVIVMDGVTIGRGAIVGAGAVVTESIPAYAIAAGVPARVIGHRTSAGDPREE